MLTEDERKEILAAIKRPEPPRLRPSPCRRPPAARGEIRRVGAAKPSVNLEAGVWVLAKHKTAKKTRKPRVIYLTPAMIELSKTLIAKNPEGAIFRGPRKNTPYSRNAVRIRFR